MSDPTLGFQVDTSGLDKGSQSLDKITQSAAKTEQQAGKTTDALNKMGSGSSGNSIAKTAQSVDQMAASLVKASREAQKNLDVTKSLESIVSKTGTSYTQASTALQNAINAHQASAAAATTNSEAVKKAADAHGALSTQAQSAFHSIRSIAEGALSGASPIQMLTQQINHLSYAASGQGGLAGAFGEVAGRITGLGPVMGSVALGVGGTVAAFLAASVELAKIGDEIERSKSRLTAITGSTKAGAEAFDLIKDAAKSTGVEFSTLESFVEKASQGIDKLNTGWPVIKVGADQAKAGLDALREMGVTLGKVMQTTGATAAEAGQVFGTLAASIAKGGNLTADTFEKIRDVSPQVGRAIASAFNYTDVNEFQKQLAKTPVPLADLERAIKRIKPAIDEAFDPDKPKTFEQATRELHSAWSELLETLAKTGAFNGITQVIGNTGREIKQIAEGFPDFGKTLQDRVSKPWADMVKVVDSSVEIDLDGAITKALAELGRLPGEGLQSIASFVNASIPLINNWAQSIISAAASAAQALASVAAGGGGTGQYDPMGNSTGVSEGNIDYSGGGGGGFNPAAMDYGGGSSDYGYFATGGSFTVGGSGGTDSQTVQFMATPGETVEITPPGGKGSQASTLASLLPTSGGGSENTVAAEDLLSADFNASLKTQTAALSDRINASRDSIVLSVNNLGPKISSAASTAATAPISTPTVPTFPTSIGSSASSSISGGGGGGFSTKKSEDGEFGSPWSLHDTPKSSQQDSAQYSSSGSSSSTGGFAGVVRGQAGVVRGFRSNMPDGAGNAVSRPLSPLDKPSGNGQDLKQQTDTLKQSQKDTSKTVADQVKSQEQLAKTIGDQANGTASDIRKLQQDSLSSLGDVGKSTGEAAQASQDGATAALDGAKASQAGADAAQEGVQATQEGSAATQQSIGQAAQATEQGSSSIVGAVGDAASAIASAVSSAMSSIGSALSNSGSYSSDYSGYNDAGANYSGDSGDSTDYASALADGTAALASGGHITGSGTATSDSIPAMLSNGEYVHNAAAVQHYGVDFMHAVNSRKLKKFADGGPTSTMPMMGGNPTADLISTHVKETLDNQSVGLKDHMEADRNKIISEIDSKVGTASSSILSAIDALGASVSARAANNNTAGSSGGRSGSNTNRTGNVFKDAAAGDGWSQDLVHNYGGAIATGGIYSTGSALALGAGTYEGAREQMRAANLMQYGYGGNFATGGTFTVGGSGGSDSQLVKIRATPGEIISITPPGGRQMDDIPGASLIPAPSMPPANQNHAQIGKVIPPSDSFGQPDRNARNVNIFVQQGVQADQFIKSRAQIQRAMS